MPTGMLFWLAQDHGGMLRTIRERGPALLVPLAWIAVGAAQFELVSPRSIFIAHLVMATFITFFLLTGWSEMQTGALAGWRAIMVVGLGVTLAGVGGFLSPSGATALWTTSLVGWMILPAVGLAYTGMLLPTATRIYVVSAAASGIGAGLYLGSLLGLTGLFAVLGLFLVGLGQTVGIVDAVIRC